VAGDRASIDDMFADDAKVLPPDADPVIGRAAIDALTAEYIEYGISEFREETTDFYGNEDLLVDQGNYVLVYGKEKVREVGKYVTVWKREGGDWKIQTNIWNTNAPSISTD
jgi:ketosteroid isomerase-like protein